jgi:hypothetical protein
MPKTILALMSLLALGCASACGNAVDAGPPAGLTGVSVTDAGHVVIIAYVCRDKVDTIQIARDREGLKETEENPVVRTYRFSRPLTGRVELDLTKPAAGWTPGTPTAFEPGKGYIVSGAGSKGYDNETSQLTLGPTSLDGLAPGSVYVSEDVDSAKLTGYTPARFVAKAKKACA